MAEHLDLWPMFERVIAPLLGEEDDPTLWPVALDTIYSDAEALARLVTGSYRVLTQIGRCSHWMAPNKARWTADGSFAWPSGYGGIGFRFTGLPEFDWFRQWACFQGHKAGWSQMAEYRPGTWSFVWLFPHGRVDTDKRQPIPFGSPAHRPFLG